MVGSYVKAGFDEYEASEEGAEMLIEASNPVLIHGAAVSPEATAKKLASTFRHAHSGFHSKSRSAGNLTHEV